MIFWRVTTPLDHTFPRYFRLPHDLDGRVISVLWFSPFAEDRRAGLIPVQPWSLWAHKSDCMFNIIKLRLAHFW